MQWKIHLAGREKRKTLKPEEEEPFTTIFFLGRAVGSAECLTAPERRVRRHIVERKQRESYAKWGKEGKCAARADIFLWGRGGLFLFGRQGLGLPATFVRMDAGAGPRGLRPDGRAPDWWINFV
jgi:hypothetical protein